MRRAGRWDRNVRYLTHRQIRMADLRLHPPASGRVMAFQAFGGPHYLKDGRGQDL